MNEEFRRRVDNMLITASPAADSITAGQHRVDLSGRAGEVKAGIRVVTPFGFAMRLVPGDAPETVVLAVEPDLRYALPPADPRYQPDDLAAGESALYNADDVDAPGCRIHLKRGHVIRVVCKRAVIEAEDLIRLDADHIQIHARKSWSWDVGGFGQKLTANAGSWQWHTWQTGAVMQPAIIDPVNPPEGPPGGL